jgi:hypothetical protein
VSFRPNLLGAHRQEDPEVAELDEEGTGGDGEGAVWRRSFSSSTTSRRRLEDCSRTPRMAGRPEARLAPTSLNQEATGETMSRREREVRCIFPFNNGGLL